MSEENKFERKWAEDSDIQTLTDEQYKAGWDFIGDEPPTVEQFNAVLNEIDDKAHIAYNKAITAQETVDTKIDNSHKSSSVTSDSEDTVATSKAVKTANSEAVEAKELADSKVSKNGDTFYGNLISVPKNKSLCGSYDPTKIDQIWSMGIDYTVSGDGSNFGNLYGLAYKYSSTEMAIGHQIILCHDGSPRVALGKNIWAKNGVDIEGNIKNSKFAGWGVSINLSAPTSLISNGKVGLGIHQNGNMYFVDEKNKKYLGYFDQDGLTITEKIKASGGTITGDLTISKANPTINFNHNSDNAVDVSIGCEGEHFYIREPEEGGKEWFRIIDDQGAYLFNHKLLTENDFNIKYITTENLDNIKVAGIYAQRADSRATSSGNYPEQQAGTLFVMPSAYGFRQEYRTYSSGRIYSRNNNASGGWKPWDLILGDDSSKKSLQNNGWCKLENGLIMQWGKALNNKEHTSETVQFPIPFRSVFSVTSSAQFPNGSWWGNMSAGTTIQNITNENFTFQMHSDYEGSGGTPAYINWIAIGK
ncbi:gp53-like domain-containing protein [Phocoenobacter skyensis]|uniref:Phage tail fibre repeat-containing protein n=1 Tax=Phocoenobacter skyensis TaxID=97481 RepID=A0A1H7XVA9_9PAST|nr:tail fiber protein [Pasteurella skyensis]QLB23306.1 hypothetical protein A6B44_08850 [Pasteurella skyensis]SEM37573.1 Phage tail fibre repeat-containing protein [Pasteurella skyensis]